MMTSWSPRLGHVASGILRGWVALLVMAVAPAAMAQQPGNLAEGRRAFDKGNYADAQSIATAALVEAPVNEEAHLLLVESLLVVGENTLADTAITAAMARLPQSLRLRWLAGEVALANGRPEDLAKLLDEIRRLYASRSWAYRNPADLIAFGRAALRLGADAKDVLDRIYTPVQKMAPKQRDLYLARGELALEKHDFTLAGTVFEEALKQLPDDPDFHYGLARAHAEGDAKVMTAAVLAALKLNPRHVPTLLLLVDRRIDEENYTEAEKLIGDVLAVNPKHPDAWALRAVLAHLRNDPAAEKNARDTALGSWPRNPRVDWLIGKKFSQKYRFAEGAERQRQALSFDPDYLPAKSQLANDLLRLGSEAEGWRLAQEVHNKDGYDVEAFNLVTLHDTMAKYATLADEDFVVRMTTREAAIYGPQVLELLAKAKRQLTEKYGAELAKPTYIEIFADPKDFAVRTFGLPDVGGFLGVCFGRVVTANSPASTAAHGTNWQAVLWHEFCHVVTLQLTANKMPRWLSEGISVYEERQSNPAWGQHLTPRYREMILKGDLTPLGKMSAAFLGPPTPEHLQFAYYQASLVVEFLVGRHGLEKIRGVLRELREGNDINLAMTNQIAPLETLEKEFADYAREHAEQLAPKLDWTKPEPALLRPGAEADLAEFGKKHSDNYWMLQQEARKLVAEKKWVEAKVPLQRLLELYPEQRGGESALRQMAVVHRALDETALEREVLEKYVAIEAEAPDACLRLVEIATAAKDWASVAANTRRFLQINPLVAPPYRALAQSAAELGDTKTAIAANRTLLQLDPPNPAEVHFHLGQLLHQSGSPEARREVLLALEEAPRHRAALNLLLTLDANRATDAGSPPSSIPATPAPLTPAPSL